jgi:hypothetical protein
VYPLCVDKCAKLDKKIEHYQKLLLGIADQLTVDRIKQLIADLQAQKATLHPEQKSSRPPQLAASFFSS